MYTLLEDNYKDLLRGQSSVTKLFPTFYNRVRDVENAGGIRMTGMQPDRWTFKVASSSGNGTYEMAVNFVDFDETIRKHVRNRQIWNKEKTTVDLRKLAHLCMTDCKIQLYCSDPSFQYWGSAYILTKRGAKYTEPEVRRPDIRNPNQYGRYCKHLAVLMGRLPMYTGTMATFIKKYHMETVNKVVDAVRNEMKRIANIKNFLKKKEDEKFGKSTKPDTSKDTAPQQGKTGAASTTKAPNKSEDPPRKVEKPSAVEPKPAQEKPEDEDDTGKDPDDKRKGDKDDGKDTPPKSSRKT